MVGFSISLSTVGGVLRRSSVVEVTPPLRMPVPPPPLPVWVRRSRPAQKARPAPVRITARTSLSAFASIRRFVS
jgi:hypothetical protein